MHHDSIGPGRRGLVPRRLAVLAFVWSLAFLAPAGAEEVRTWTDVKGKFKIQAKLVSVEGGKVTLARPDGTELEIELPKLSEADRKYVTEVEAKGENPFKPAASDPFKPKGKKAAGGAAVAESRVIVPDWSDVREVSPASTGEWKLTPGAPLDAALKLKTKPIPIPPKRNFFEGTQALVVNAASRRAVVGYKVDEPKPAGLTRIALVDLEAGKTLGTASAPGHFLPTSLNDDGTQVLMGRRHDGPFGGISDRLEIWSLAGSGIKKGLQWAPYDNLTEKARNVGYSEFVDARHVVTVSKPGKLAFWDLDAVEKPVYTLQIQGESTPAMSPDRKWLAFSTGKEASILDLAAGEVIASQPLPTANPAWPAFAFSATGKRLAFLAFNDKIHVWDVATGALYRSLTLHGLGNLQGQILFPTDDQVLLGGKTLVDLDSQVRLWNYDGAEFVKRLGGLCWFEVADGERNPGALVPLALPHPAAKAALDRAMADPNFFVLKPNVTTVKVDTSALPDPAQRDKVRAALEARLKAAGFKAGPTGTIDLVASTEVGKEQQIHYRLWGGGLKSFNLQPYTSRLRFVSGGQTAWESSAAHIPFSMAKDETQESYQQKYQKPNYEYFAGVELPRFLTKPTASGTVGTGRITTAGLK